MGADCSADVSVPESESLRGQPAPRDVLTDLRGEEGRPAALRFSVVTGPVGGTPRCRGFLTLSVSHCNLCSHIYVYLLQL